MLNICPKCSCSEFSSYISKDNKFFIRCDNCNSEYEIDSTPLIDLEAEEDENEDRLNAI